MIINTFILPNLHFYFHFFNYLPVYEASGKPKNGKLFGYNGDLGDFDQCLSIQTNTDSKIQFTGQYCLLSIQTSEADLIKEREDYKKNVKGLSESSKFITDFSLGTVQGICLPSTCNIENVADSINKSKNGYKITEIII